MILSRLKLSGFLVPKVFLILLLLTFPRLSAAQQELEGIVVQIRDGDTIKIKTDNGRLVRVRLAGIDAPEAGKYTRDGALVKPGQPFWGEASDHLKNFIYKKHVRLEVLDVDSYRRMLAFVFLDGTNINLEMVKAGFAEAYANKPQDFGIYREALQAAESEAHAGKKGMWVQGKGYESPKSFRARMKRRGKE